MIELFVVTLTSPETQATEHTGSMEPILGIPLAQPFMVNFYPMNNSLLLTARTPDTGGILFLCAYSAYLLMTLIKPVQRRIFYICFGGFLLLLLTISTASNNAFCELMWIEKRNNPGDTATDCAANILTDGLLVSLQHMLLSSSSTHTS
jgi:hypothetical protein